MANRSATNLAFLATLIWLVGYVHHCTCRQGGCCAEQSFGSVAPIESESEATCCGEHPLKAAASDKSPDCCGPVCLCAKSKTLVSSVSPTSQGDIALHVSTVTWQEGQEGMVKNRPDRDFPSKNGVSALSLAALCRWLK